VGRDPGDLYEMSPAAAEPDDDLVMLYYLDGFIDAGSAGRLLATHLLSTLEHEEVARFDVDALIDYRSRRPIMSYAKDHWEDYETPELTLSLLRDAEGTQFLLLNGLEPDREWEAFTKLQVPGSAAALLEYRLGQEDRAALGFAVHVPHYLAQAAYPAAAVTLLESVQRATGLVIPGDSLREAAHRTDLEIARQVEGSAEVGEVVEALEQQYDAFTAGRENLLGSDSEPMPTAEELGAEFERFLAEQQGRGDGTEN
jgi:hypothetical protein